MKVKMNNTHCEGSLDLLDNIEARTALKISRNTLRELVNRGQIPTVKIGRRRLFKKSDLIRFVDSCTGPVQS